MGTQKLTASNSGCRSSWGKIAMNRLCLSSGPKIPGKPVVRVAHGEGLEDVVIIVQRQGKLLEVVGALSAAGGLAR